MLSQIWKRRVIARSVAYNLIMPEYTASELFDQYPSGFEAAVVSFDAKTLDGAERIVGDLVAEVGKLGTFTFEEVRVPNNEEKIVDGDRVRIQKTKGIILVSLFPTSV